MRKTTSRHRPRTTAKVRPDGHVKKRFPAGISSTILAIQNYWPSLSGDGRECMTVREFCDAGFCDVYERVVGHYPGIVKKATKRTGINKMMHMLCNGKQDIEFFHLRAFAEYVGLPTGLFLLFTQMVSDERHCLSPAHQRETGDSSREQSLTFILRVRRVIEAAERQIELRTPGEPIFNHLYGEGPSQEQHMAEARTLKLWSDVFNGIQHTDSSKLAV